MRFSGKVVVITGGAQGIGRSTAERFVQEGARVVIADVNSEGLFATAAEIGTDENVLAVVTDVAEKDQVDTLIGETLRNFGRIDVMVNNAGIASVMDFLEVTPDIFDHVIGVNLKGAFLGTQAAARAMIAQGEGGVIINMSSINSGLANPNVATYAISKGGMNQVTSTAAVAFAPHGIRVCGIGPGTIATEIIKGAFTERAGMDAILSRTPMGRLGEPEEIAGVVAFLASEDASYFTGETIYPDGGRRILNYTVPVRE
ncbi:SDR family NAD(P)-dependent oxidoreductase [Marimonas lutisalis]|uniref:SDR family NAD(P)-dependent oxidoreductase n=1 Tax=Marimonas lutisalis TaxID=2545756 RepID=UPI0010F54DD1|nr:SDR family oxidoreductase [Marimonas lutisalis]